MSYGACVGNEGLNSLLFLDAFNRINGTETALLHSQGNQSQNVS